MGACISCTHLLSCRGHLAALFNFGTRLPDPHELLPPLQCLLTQRWRRGLWLSWSRC